MSETLSQIGTLVGHNGWVTSIAFTPNTNEETMNMLVSCSRDKTLLKWDLTRQQGEDYGHPRLLMRGHSNFVQDVVVSSDGQFALSGSWDGTLRLWDLTTGVSTRTFVGHTSDVLSVAFSADNRQIVSGSRDKTIKLWNTVGDCKFTYGPSPSGQAFPNSHSDWVSSVKFSPSADPLIVSAGWDAKVKVWQFTGQANQCKYSLEQHTEYLNTVTVSPDGSLCASGGRDGKANLWDLTEGKILYTLDAGDSINALCFSPNRYWLCAAVGNAIKIWDLESKVITQTLIPDNLPEPVADGHGIQHRALCLTWQNDGNVLFVGYTDSKIRVFHVMSA